MSGPVKILFWGDSHLGFDLPLQPRIERRRRGEDFFANYQLILSLARRKKVDLVIHGGDFFFRSKVSPAIVDQAYESLFNLATTGIPIYIVPGNHDRSRLPEHLYLAHENIQIFHQPATYTRLIKGKTIALSGFPFTRKARDQFQSLLKETHWKQVQADVRFLCLHQTFEGAVVGPVEYTFRAGPEVIPHQLVPEEFSAVLSGHIHRAQQLDRGLDGQPLAVPVIYPGSIERTSVAERFEEKSIYLICLTWIGGKLEQKVERIPLPTRPMVKVTVPVWDYPPEQVLMHIKGQLSLLKPDAVVRVELTGNRADQVQRSISASSLRSTAPGSMNISFGLNLRAQAG